MKKSTSYAPYLYAILMTLFSAITHNLLFKQGIILNLIVVSVVILGLWRLIEWLLTLSENKWVQWGSALVGSSLFILAFICLDYYVLLTLEYG
jgi:hypothetical protein